MRFCFPCLDTPKTKGEASVVQEKKLQSSSKNEHGASFKEKTPLSIPKNDLSDASVQKKSADSRFKNKYDVVKESPPRSNPKSDRVLEESRRETVSVSNPKNEPNTPLKENSLQDEALVVQERKLRSSTKNEHGASFKEKTPLSIPKNDLSEASVQKKSADSRFNNRYDVVKESPPRSNPKSDRVLEASLPEKALHFKSKNEHERPPYRETSQTSNSNSNSSSSSTLEEKSSKANSNRGGIDVGKATTTTMTITTHGTGTSVITVSATHGLHGRGGEDDGYNGRVQ